MKLSVVSILILVGASAAAATHSQRARATRNHHREIVARQHHPQRNASMHVLERRGTGFATFYNTETGNAGSCGSMLSNNDFTVALASPGWNINPNACGQTIRISANGRTTTARIEDTCPTGGGNCGGPCDIDMSPSLFSFFADQSVGKMQVSWTYANGQNCDGSGGSNNNDNNNDSGSDGAAAAASASSVSASKASASRSAAASRASVAASKSSKKHASYLSSKKAASSAAAAAASYAAQPKNVLQLNQAFNGFKQLAQLAKN